MVDPLPPGARLVERFEILAVLGRGGFSIVYRARDLRRGDLAVVKEFAPVEARRSPEGTVELGPNAAAVRHAFLEEARTVGRLHAPGILPLRLAFVDRGTAYVVTDLVPDAKTLDALVREQGPLDADGVLDLAFQLIETLGVVHRQGLLHRDLKPSNVLVSPEGRAYLLDFGAAREWTADANDSHTVIYTPGFAPPEQRTAVARRGPGTDVYGLCATLYAALTGRPPTDAASRAGGEPLLPLRDAREDLDPDVARAIESGLALRLAERPESVDELRRRFELGPDRRELDTLGSLDELLVRSRRFTFGRRACPACGGILEAARPIPKDACPTCRRGRVRVRRLSDRACPRCRMGVLRPTKGGERPLACDECDARFLAESDGRRRELSSGRTLAPDQWARVAAGLNPDGGDASCDACDAEYRIDGDRLTLLWAAEDPHGFAAAFRGRALPLERARWLAVGKRSPQRGLVCDRCDTEFDHTGGLLTLVGSVNRRLDRHAGDTRTLDAWHRIAEGVPEPGRQAELEERIAQSLVAAYRRGEVGFDGLLWRGPAIFEGRPTSLVVRPEGLKVGRGFRARHLRMAELHELRTEGDWLFAEGPLGPVEIEIGPVELVARLRSGDRAVLLTALDLAARLAWNGLAQAYRVSESQNG